MSPAWRTNHCSRRIGIGIGIGIGNLELELEIWNWNWNWIWNVVGPEFFDVSLLKTWGFEWKQLSVMVICHEDDVGYQGPVGSHWSCREVLRSEFGSNSGVLGERGRARGTGRNTPELEQKVHGWQLLQTKVHEDSRGYKSSPRET